MYNNDRQNDAVLDLELDHFFISLYFDNFNINMGKKCSIPRNWPSDIIYLTSNEFSPPLLKPPNPFPFPLPTLKHPNHPFTTSNLLPIFPSPPMPNPNVIIKKLTQDDHPAYPGYGLFANKDLKECNVVVCYTGKVTTREIGGEEGSDYVLGFGNELCIDGWKKGNIFL